MSDPSSDVFGDALRRHRLAAGLSQQALAERAGLSVRGISDLERGRRRVPRLETVRMIADGLGLDDAGRQELIQAGRTRALGRPVADPPSSSAAEPARSALPPAPTPLIGRAHDVAEVVALMRGPEIRLVTLTGPGGTGKTRLALQVASDLAPEFRDGVLFIPLATLGSAELVLPSVAEALGLHDASAVPLSERVSAKLRETMVLLVLDNFEHVTDAALEIFDVLLGCPHVKVLATSRTPLHLRLEHVIDVNPLGLPRPGHVPGVDQLHAYGALALFVARARAATNRFTVTDENIATIATICERLDGLPLAIELAAARLRAITPDELLVRLDRSLAFLIGGPSDLPARHQTLRSTIGWSYGLLGDGDRRLFRRLSGFASGWTLDAACAIAGVPDGDERGEAAVVDGLTVLIDQHLVRRTARAGDPSRYEMLTTIREYGLEQLDQSGEAAEVQHILAALYLSYVQHRSTGFYGRQAAELLKQVELEYDNVRAALRWTIDHRDARMALAYGAALREFWSVRGLVSEGRRWLELALELDGADAATRIRALEAASALACHYGDLDHAERLAMESLALNQQIDDLGGIARARHTLGLVAQLRHEYERARVLYDECLALKRRVPGAELTRTMGNLAQIRFHLGDAQGSIELFDECIALDQAAGDVTHLALHLTDLGLALLESGADARARQVFETALPMHYEIGHLRMITYTIEGLAAVAGKQHRAERAACLYGAAETLRDVSDNPLQDPDEWGYARHFCHARSQMDETSFAAAWALGRTMTVDEAVHYALSAPGSCSS